MLKSIDFWPLVPKKLSVESSINDNTHQKSMFSELRYDFKLLLGLRNLLCTIFEFCTLTFDHVVFFAGDTDLSK